MPPTQVLEVIATLISCLLLIVKSDELPMMFGEGGTA